MSYVLDQKIIETDFQRFVRGTILSVLMIFEREGGTSFLQFVKWFKSYCQKTVITNQ